jgi:hypothetical protein
VSHEALLWARSVRGLTPSERLVLSNLADHCRKGQNRSWPAVGTIAYEEGDLSERTVRRALRSLRNRQLLQVVRPGGGRRLTTIYALAMPGYPVTVTGFSGQYGDKCDTNTVTHSPKTVTLTTENPVTVAPEPVIEPVKNQDKRTARGGSKLPATRTGRPAVAASVEPPGFREFWTGYPRRVARAEAVKSYLQAVKRDGPDVIATGAATWANHWQAEGTEQRYIPHPTTWLNQSRYLDEPPASRAGEPKSWGGLRRWSERDP